MDPKIQKTMVILILPRLENFTKGAIVNERELLPQVIDSGPGEKVEGNGPTKHVNKSQH